MDVPLVDDAVAPSLVDAPGGTVLLADETPVDSASPVADVLPSEDTTIEIDTAAPVETDRVAELSRFKVSQLKEMAKSKRLEVPAGAVKKQLVALLTGASGT